MNRPVATWIFVLGRRLALAECNIKPVWRMRAVCLGYRPAGHHRSVLTGVGRRWARALSRCAGIPAPDARREAPWRPPGAEDSTVIGPVGDPGVPPSPLSPGPGCGRGADRPSGAGPKGRPRRSDPRGAVGLQPPRLRARRRFSPARVPADCPATRRTEPGRLAWMPPARPKAPAAPGDLPLKPAFPWLYVADHGRQGAPAGAIQASAALQRRLWTACPRIGRNRDAGKMECGPLSVSPRARGGQQGARRKASTRRSESSLRPIAHAMSHKYPRGRGYWALAEAKIHAP